MTRLITFTDQNMTIAAEICKQSALANNVHEAKIYTPADIDPEFKATNKAIFDQPRGYGYWLWKPYFIDRALKEMNEGDVLIYSDAGVEFVNNINFIVERMQDIWLFGNMWQHVHWCKGDVMAAVLSPTPWEWYVFGKQCQASVIIMRAGKTAIELTKKWLNLCIQPGLIDDSPSKAPNNPEFKEHRHDQAIISTLAYKEGIPFHWWPAMYNAGNFTYDKTGYTDNYPILFHHHRMRNDQFSATDDLNRHMQRYFKSRYKIAA